MKKRLSSRDQYRFRILGRAMTVRLAVVRLPSYIAPGKATFPGSFCKMELLHLQMLKKFRVLRR